jgi:hypothetical protein
VLHHHHPDLPRVRNLADQRRGSHPRKFSKCYLMSINTIRHNFRR